MTLIAVYPVAQMVDNAIQSILQLVFLILIDWIVIYPMDSATQLFNNCGELKLSN